MIKLNYEIPEIAIILFNNDDVIRASYSQNTTEDDDKDIELPFVPIKPKNY